MRYGVGKAEMPRPSGKERKGGWEGENGRESKVGDCNIFNADSAAREDGRG